MNIKNRVEYLHERIYRQEAILSELLRFLNIEAEEKLINIYYKNRIL